MKKALFAILLFAVLTAFLATVAEARKPVVIYGKVTDGAGKPIGSALVAIAALSESTTTDSAGTYRLTVVSRVRAGQKVVVVASREGYDYGRRSVTLAPGIAAKQNFRLPVSR
jgi:hypothetical protein